MTVVVDVGCYDHPDHPGSSQDSVGKLIERFRPFELYGYDPHPKMPERASFDRDGTRVTLMRAAVWTEPGTVGYDASPQSPLSANIFADGVEVPCVGISSIVTIGSGERLILKLDVEGAEYPLLRRLIQTNAIRYVDRLLVEWHDLPVRADEREELLARIPCPIEEWA